MSTAVKTPSLKSLAKSLVDVSQKKGLTYKELETLASIKTGIVDILKQLRECEVCGSAVTEIVRLEIDGTRASICPSCGIKALRNKQLKLRKKPSKPAKTKKAGGKARTTTSKSARSGAVKTTRKKPRLATQVTMQLGLPEIGAEDKKMAADFSGLAARSGIKLGHIRKIHKIANEIAMPMSLEGTLSFTKSEAAKDNINIDDSKLRSILVALTENHGLRIRR